MISSEEMKILSPHIYGLGRGKKNLESMLRLSENNQIQISLSKIFADRVLSPFKQDVSLFLEGRKGSGKSYASLAIAYATAKEIAKRKGGVWQDYFNINRNIAIISPEEAYNLMQNLRDYNVYILDDIGVGWNARTFQQKENRMMNDIFEVCRIKRTVIIFSAPAAFLIDKVPRELASFRAEIAESIHEKGYVAIKLKTPIRISQMDKTILPYLTIGRNKIVRFLIQEPPSDLAKAYDQLRTDRTNQLLLEHSTDMNNPKLTKDITEEKRMDRDRKFFEAAYLNEVRRVPLKEACKKVGLSDNTFRQIKKEKNFT